MSWITRISSSCGTGAITAYPSLLARCILRSIPSSAFQRYTAWKRLQAQRGGRTKRRSTPAPTGTEHPVSSLRGKKDAEILKRLLYPPPSLLPPHWCPQTNHTLFHLLRSFLLFQVRLKPCASYPTSPSRIASSSSGSGISLQNIAIS